MPTIHRGQIVKDVLKERSVNKAELARKLKKGYKTIHRWLSNPNLPMERIDRIGEAIDYDFSKHFPPKGWPSLDINQTLSSLPKGLTIEEAYLQYENLRSKYMYLQQNFEEISMQLFRYIQRYGLLK